MERRGGHSEREPAHHPRSLSAQTEPVPRWRCRSCSAARIDRGDGFPGHRFSACLRCGAHAVEAANSGAAWEPLPPPLRAR